MTVITTGEQRNKGAVLTSLSELLKTVIASFNPQNGTFGVLEDPTLRRIFDDIVEISGSGISPISLGAASATKQTPQAQLAPAPLPTSPIPTTLSAPLAPAVK